MISGLPKAPVEIESISYKTPKRGEWFLSRYSDDWIKCETKKLQKHLVIKERK